MPIQLPKNKELLVNGGNLFLIKEEQKTSWKAENHINGTLLKNLWKNNKPLFEQAEKCDTAFCMNIIEC